jgi:hypothetical protein
MIFMERAQQGWWRVQALYGFSRARAVERLVRAAPDPASPSK